MSEKIVLDKTGRRRSPAVMPGYRAGCAPANKGMRYPPDPPRVEEMGVADRRSAPQAPTLSTGPDVVPFRNRYGGAERVGLPVRKLLLAPLESWWRRCGLASVTLWQETQFLRNDRARPSARSRRSR